MHQISRGVFKLSFPKQVFP